jgi:hypothetical protein
MIVLTAPLISLLVTVGVPENAKEEELEPKNIAPIPIGAG